MGQSTDLQHQIEELSRENRLLQQSLHQAYRLGRLRDKALRDLKIVEQCLRQSKSRFFKIAMEAADGIVMVDQHEKIIFWNPAATEILGYSAEEAIDKNMHDLIVPAGDLHQAHTRFAEFGPTSSGAYVGYSVERQARRKDGSEVLVQITISPFKSGDQWQALCTLRDISERRGRESNLYYLATHDSLTGVYNRRGLDMRLEQDLRRAARYGHALSVLMIDLNHFKQVNDMHGHQAGDGVLQKVAVVLESQVREVDYVSRLGGDEFIVVLGETGKENARNAAQRIYTLLMREPVSLADHTLIPVSASIGIATFPEDGKTPETLFAVADREMYASKTAGRRRDR